MCRYINREVRNREAEKQICSNYYLKRYTRVFSVLFKKIHPQILTFSLLTDHRLRPRFLTTILSTSSHKKNREIPSSKTAIAGRFLSSWSVRGFPRKRRKGPARSPKCNQLFTALPPAEVTSGELSLSICGFPHSGKPTNRIAQSPQSLVFFSGGPDSAPRR